jgi:uncharacterized protein YndB with AHSA1/START domain
MENMNKNSGENNKADQPYNKTIQIDASAMQIWEALTVPWQMKQWMNMPELVIDTDWVEGNAIRMSGVSNRVPFTNSGMVLNFEPGKLLRYSHLSSLSKLEDKAENYAILEFVLTPKENSTELKFTASNFYTPAIYHHFAFYWNVALELLKKFVERS